MPRKSKRKTRKGAPLDTDPLPFVIESESLPSQQFHACLRRRRRPALYHPSDPLTSLMHRCWPGEVISRAIRGTHLDASERAVMDYEDGRPALAALMTMVVTGPWAISRRRHATVARDSLPRHPTVEDVVAATCLGGEDEGIPLAALCVLSVLCRCALDSAAVAADARTRGHWVSLYDALLACPFSVHDAKAFSRVSDALFAFPALLDPFAWTESVSAAHVRQAVHHTGTPEQRDRVARLALTTVCDLPALMAYVFRRRRICSGDPIFEAVMHLFAGLLCAACQEMGGEVDCDRILQIVRGDTCASLLSDLDVRSAGAIVCAAEAVRSAQAITLLRLPRDVVQLQCEALDRRYGVVRTPNVSFLVLCTRCKLPHTIQNCQPGEAIDGYSRLRHDVLTCQFSCAAGKAGVPSTARIFPVQLLGHFVIVARHVYTICCTCGNRCEVHVAKTGYSAQACESCAAELSRRK